MGKSDEKKSHFPFIVRMDDELLSSTEIESRQNEARNVQVEIRTLSRKEGLVSFGRFCMYVITLNSILASGLIRFVEDKDPSIYVYFAFTAIVVTVFFHSVREKYNKEIASLRAIDRSEIFFIDSDASACDHLNRWMAQDETVKRYVEKIGALGRLPTFAEFHCVEKYIKDKERTEPVENLKSALNLKTA